MAEPLEIHTVTSQPFEENTYIVHRRASKEAIVVDPGMQPELILELLEERGLSVVAILNTHGHGDHIAGNEALKQAFPTAPLVIGVNEAHLLTDAMANLTALFGMPIVSPPADRLLTEGETIDYAGIPLEVREIPGHSPGHVVFVYHAKPSVILGGDVLFRGSIGRCDFPGGRLELLLEGISTKLLTLPGDSVVYPGHGPVTTIAHEARTNPYLG